MLWFVLTVIAVFFIVTETVLEKKTLVGTRSMEFAALFAFGNAIVLLPLLFKINFTQLNSEVLFLIFLAAIPSASASFLAFKTIKHNQLSEAAPIFALMPLVVTLFAFVFLKEKVTASQLLGIIMIVFGMIFLELKNFKLSCGIFTKGRGKYIFYIALYLLIGGISAMFDRVVLHSLKLDALTYLIFIQLFIAINYGIFLIFKKSEFLEVKKQAGKNWKIIILVCLFTVTHRYLYANAIQLASSMGIVVAVYRLSSLAQVFIGGKIFKEEDIFKKVLASIIILTGTVILAIK